MTTDTQPMATQREFGQFLSDVMTAAGLVTHGKQCKALGDRLADMCVRLRRWGQPAHSGEPVAWLDPWTGAKVTTDYDAYGKHGIPLYTAPQPVEREPLTHAQAKALVLKYGNDPLHLVLQVERAHGIKGDQHV